MKKIAVVLAVVLAVFIVGCKPTASDVKSAYAPPNELKDCSFHRLESTSGSTLTVVRCPNSSTSTVTSGKHPTRTIVVDGVEYTQKSEQ